MAGFDWFRWHQGSVTDPKFGLVAKKAGARRGDVLSVWACLLEAASAAEDRGNPGTPDFEALDYLLDLDEGTAQRIYERMCERNLVDAATGRIVAWEKRQPKREREDDTSTDRVRAYRERKRQEAAGNTTSGDETPRNASETAGTPREEKSREEEKDTHTEREGAACVGVNVDGFEPTPAGRVCRVMRAEGIADVNPGHPELRTLLEAGATDEEFAGAARTAASKRKGFAYALGTLTRQRQEAAQKAEGLHRGAMPPSTPPPTVPSSEPEKTQAYLATQTLTPEQRAREAERAAEIRRQRGLGRDARASP
jgi:hypothetical protein